MSHSHSHPPGPHKHSHAHVEAGPGGGARRALWIALIITLSFSVVEAVGGWMAGSLALLSDAGHMIADCAALGLALFADAIARRPPSKRASYGYGRARGACGHSSMRLRCWRWSPPSPSRPCAGCSIPPLSRVGC